MTQWMEDLDEIAEKIAQMRQIATELMSAARDFPALTRNTARILAGIRMLEINLTDALEPAGVSSQHSTTPGDSAG